ncbi:MAG: hypothetical protein HYT31_00965 [Parcubacteria group bacterium]|nr:hypothetical protein [Parcubacteria group bacterium]
MSGKFLLLKKYWPLVAVALLVGTFSVLPLFFSLQRMGDSFQGIWPQFNDDANFYLSRAHEALDGHLDMNNPYVAEHKDETYPQAVGGELFMAFFAWSLHISIPALQAGLTFVSPALMAALFYLLLMLLYPNRASSFVLSLAFFTVVTGGMTKPIHPVVSFPLLLIFLLSWFGLILENKYKRLRTLMCGLALGLLFLTYFFHWSFLLVVLGVYALLLIVRRDHVQFKRHLAIAAVALVIAGPYLVRVIFGVEAPFYHEMALRMGVFSTHWPETFPRLAVALVWLAFFIFVTRHYCLQREQRSHILFALLIANVVYPNHQIITGITVENANHWSYMPIFVYFLAGQYLFNVIFKHAWAARKMFDASVAGAVALMVAVPAWRLQTFNFPPYQRSLRIAATEEIEQRYTDSLAWINGNAPTDSVVFSNLGFMWLVPVYTHANVYYSENAYYLLASDAEIIERTLLFHFFDIGQFKAANFGLGEVPRILWTQPAMIERNTHWLHDRLGVPWTTEFSLARELALVQSTYDRLAQNGWNLDLLRRYRLDYFVWDKTLNPEWKLDQYPDLAKVYDRDGIAIFMFNDMAHGA